MQGAVWHIRLAGSREVPRLELIGTRPEKVSSILASCSCHCPVVSARREKRFLGRGEHVGLSKVLFWRSHKALAQGSRPKPLQAVPESQEERASARAQNMPHPIQPRPPRRTPAHPAVGPTHSSVRLRLAPARCQAPREGARRAGPGARATPATSLGPKSPPRPRLRRPASRAWRLLAAPGGGVLFAPGRARRPRASPLERTGESPLRRAGPARGRSGQVCSGAGDPRDPESYSSLSRSSSRPELSGAP